MSYESYLDSELKLAGLELEPGERERLSAIFKIINEQGHSGGSMSILLPHLRHKLESASERDATVLFSADDFSEGLAKPVFQALNGLTLERALVVGDYALKTLSFTPFSPLTGDDSEWVEVSHDMLQNRRMATVFKDVESGVACWLDASRLHYPGRYLGDARYSSHSHQGVVSFPFDPSVGTKKYYYTSESLRQHVVRAVNPVSAFLTQTMLTTAAGGVGTDTQLSANLEIIDPTTAETLIATFTDFWAAAIGATEVANKEYHAYNVHRVALDELRHKSDHEVDSDKPNDDQPETVTVFGLTIPYEFIPHLARLVSFLPDHTVVQDGRLVNQYDSNLSGQFVTVPVFTVSADSQSWIELPGVVTVIWHDALVDTSRVYLAVSVNGVDVISGDAGSWLWDYRERNHIDHPNRDTVGSRTVRRIDDEFSNPSVAE